FSRRPPFELLSLLLLTCPAPPETYTLSLHDALPICARSPVTPNITIELGPAMSGMRRSRGSRSGLGESAPVRRVEESVTIVLSRTAAQEHGPPRWPGRAPGGVRLGR